MSFGLPTFGEPVFGDPFGPDAAADSFLGEAFSERDLTTLVSVQYRRRSTNFATDAFAPLFGAPVFGEPNIEASDEIAAVEQFVFSNRGWVALPNEPLRADTAAIPRALSAINVTNSAAINPGRATRSASTDGFVELDNADGSLDALFATAEPNGLPVTVTTGNSLTFTNRWTQRFRARARSQTASNDRIRIELQGTTTPLAVPLNGFVFAGTGAADGDEAVRGRQHPTCLGYCFNISPVLIDRGRALYRYDSGPTGPVTAARDGGATLNIAGDFDNVLELIAADLPEGSVGVCTREGLVRPWQTPDGVFTIDAEGRRSSGRSLATMRDAALLCAQRAGLQFAEIDLVALGVLPLDELSYYDPGGATALDLMDDIAVALGGFHGFSRAGLFTLRAWVPPETATVGRLVRADGISITADDTDLPIVTRQSVVWRKNHTPMSDSQIRSGVPDTERARLASRGQEEVAFNGAASVFDGAAPGDDVVSILATQAGAARLASQIIGLVGRPRVYFNATTGVDGSVLEVGDVVQLETDRLGASSSLLLVQEIAERDNPRDNTARLLGTPVGVPTPYRWGSAGSI